MKLTITNTGENKVKIITREGADRNGGLSGDEFQSGLVEQFVEPGQSIQVEGWYSAVEYVPGAAAPEFPSVGG